MVIPIKPTCVTVGVIKTNYFAKIPTNLSNAKYLQIILTKIIEIFAYNIFHDLEIELTVLPGNSLMLLLMGELMAKHRSYEIAVMVQMALSPEPAPRLANKMQPITDVRLVILAAVSPGLVVMEESSFLR